MSRAGAPREPMIAVFSVPFVFQRRDTAAAKFVNGTLDRFVPFTEIWSSVRRAGRSLARSSSRRVQLLTQRLLTHAANELVTCDNAAKPFVTDCNNSKIASCVLVVSSAFGWAMTTSLVVTTGVSRFKKS